MDEGFVAGWAALVIGNVWMAVGDRLLALPWLALSVIFFVADYSHKRRALRRLLQHIETSPSAATQEVEAP